MEVERNAAIALTQLLRLAKVSVTDLTIRQWLGDHPDYPGLSALSDVLTDLKVPNLVTQLPANRLNTIPLPALVQLRNENEFLVPVRKITVDTVEWLNDTNTWHDEPLTEFLKKWTGIALLIEPNSQSGEVGYATSRRQEQIKQVARFSMFLGALVCLCVIARAVWVMAPIAVAGLVLVKVTGLTISILLVWYTLNSDQPILQKLCNLGGKSASCQSVLTSPAGRLFGWLSWSEIGLLYFSSGLILLIGSILTTTPNLINWVVALNGLALPYTFWSVFYQAFVLQQWCLLCLSILAILWAEFLISTSLWPSLAVPLSGFGPFVAVGIAVLILWLLLRTPLRLAQQVKPLRRNLQRLKFSNACLHDALTNAPRQLAYPADLRPLILGNPSGKHTLTLVTNPVCEACQIAHAQLQNLLRRMPDLRVEIILATSTHTDDKAAQVSKALLRLPANRVHAALSLWFKNPVQFVARWCRQIGIDVPADCPDSTLTLHTQWCIQAGIAHTPVLFLNGVRLLPPYQLTDVLYLCRIWPAKESFTFPMDLAKSR